MVSSPCLDLAYSAMFHPVGSALHLPRERQVLIYFTIIYPLFCLIFWLNCKLEGRDLQRIPCFVEPWYMLVNEHILRASISNSTQQMVSP